MARFDIKRAAPPEGGVASTPSDGAVGVTLSTVRWCTLLGAAAGVIWAFAGISGVLVFLVTTAIGAAIGLALSRGVIDWRALLGDREDT